MTLELGTYFDISPVLSERTAVFPGDESFCRQEGLAFKKGDHLGLSSIKTTVHLGAHTDAPNHYHPAGRGIETRNLNYYFGACQVIDVEKQLKPHERIRPAHLRGQSIQAKRVLFKTGSFADPDRWTGDFNSLSAELVDFLAGQGVILVGIDTPSIDPAEDKTLESHHAVFNNDQAVLEGVVLAKVSDGVYTLMALPLPLKGADASPVRAVLVKEFKNA